MTNPEVPTFCRKCGHVHTGADYCTDNFNCVCKNVPTPSTEAREWRIKNGNCDSPLHSEIDLLTTNERCLGPRGTRAGALDKVLEAYHAHKNQGLAEKAAREAAESIATDTYGEHRNASVNFEINKNAAIIQSCIERNGKQ